MGLEAPPRAAEAVQGRRRLLERQPRLPAGRQRRERVQHVVPAGNLQLDRRLLGTEARAQLEQLDLARGERPGAEAERHRGRHRGQLEPDGGDQRGHRPGEVGECLLHLGERAVGGVVVELDVRDHRHLRLELQERAVGLVRLHHDPVTLAPGGVGAGRAHLAADQVGRPSPAGHQRVRHHARRGGLAVRPGHGHAALEPRHLRQQLAAMDHAGARAPAPPAAPGCPRRSRSTRPPRHPV